MSSLTTHLGLGGLQNLLLLCLLLLDDDDVDKVADVLSCMYTADVKEF